MGKPAPLKRNCLRCETGEGWLLHKARGLCVACYTEVLRNGELDQYPTIQNCSGDPQCTYVHQDGVRCPKNRAVKKDGTYHSTLCHGHINRRKRKQWMEPKIGSPRYARETDQAQFP